MDAADFLKGRTRETSIARDGDGCWSHDGLPLEHRKLTRAFDGWIDRAQDGRYCLKNDINWAYIEVQGPPYFVRSLAIAEDGHVTLRLSGDRTEPLSVDSLRQDTRGALYCDVLGGRLTARFDSHATAQLESLVDEDERGVYLTLGERRVRPPVVDQPLL